MSLSSTLSIAQSSLATNAALSTIVSRNIAGVNDPNYSAKTGLVATSLFGGATLTGVRNATNDALFANLLSAKSNAASSSALLDGLNTIEQSLGLTTSSASASATSTDTSPATLLSKLTAALQQYAASPADATLGQAVVTAAKSLAASLKGADSTVQGVRVQADKGIQSAVGSINGLLKQFGDANNAVIEATSAGSDATDALDQRNKILSSLSEQIGITTASTGNGGLVIYTDGGAMLFQGTARTVSFAPTAGFASGTAGSPLVVDGVPVTGAGSVMATTTGRIAGLIQLRDTTAVNYGNQLDQIAQGLITSFSETDQTGGGAPAVAGLFTAGGSTTIPASATGLAASLSVAASVDPSRGGSVTLLRDGGIGGGGNAAYTANTTGAASYAAHLDAILATLDTAQSFDARSGGSATGTLSAYAASSVGWLETARQDASTISTDRTAVVTQSTTSLSSATGVNLDEQLSKMLDLEHSYQASAELMTTVKAMLDSLLAAIH